MSSVEITPDKICFIDPESDSSVSYTDCENRCLIDDVNSNTSQEQLRSQEKPSEISSCFPSFIFQFISNVVLGHDFVLENGRLQTKSINTGTDSSFTTESISLTSPKQTIQDGFWRAFKKSQSRFRIMSSGTTGVPKQVEHTVPSLTRGVRSGVRHENDVWGLAYPLDHLAGLQVLFQALFNRNTIVQLFGLPAKEIHQAIDKYDVTHLSCTPTLLKMLASDRRVHSNIRRLTTGGERCDSATIAAIKRMFPNAKHRNIYALTEVGNLLIGDGDRFTVPADLKDLVCVKQGGLAIHCSLLADSRVAEAGNSEGDWFQTGDLIDVVVEAPLTFRFVARQDDVINVGGYKVVPQVVEDQLLKHPSIQQAVVYGRKNSVTGQIVVCDVVLDSGEELDMVSTKRNLADQLPRYAVPRLINVVDSLRMTASGKLCRNHEPS